MGPLTGIRAASALFFLLGVIGSPLEAWGFTPTVMANGTPVRWKGLPHLNLAGNPRNQKDFSEESFREAVVRGLRRWQVAAAGAVSFDYWQGTDSRIFPAVSAYDGLSAIYFSSNSGNSGEASGSATSNNLTANVLGLTQVWYDTTSGEILEADIALNDRDFHFTTDVRDTSGYGSGTPRFTGPRSNVFIENVITHELGHALGLSHSGGLQSTMLFMESPEQAHLGCDELVGIHALYPSSDGGARGTLTGAVVNSGGAPVFGAHVLIISRRRGTVLASGITDRAGRYSVEALEPGTYFVMVEPFYAGAPTLPAFYSSVRSDVCSGGRSFNRTILTDPSGVQLQPIRVAPGAAVSAPTVHVSCADFSGAAVVGTKGQESSVAFVGATQIFNGLAGESGLGAADRFRSTAPNYYKFESIFGHLELHAMSYSLYSPIQAVVELLDSAGLPVSTQVANEVYVGDSGYVNYDSALVASNLPAGDYYLRVTAKPLDSMLYPAGPISLDPVPFVVITGSYNETGPPLAESLPYNARCRMEELYPPYKSPPGNPPRSLVSSEKQDANVGFCGTIRSDSSGGSGPSAGAMVGWFLPWILMLTGRELARTARSCLIRGGRLT